MSGVAAAFAEARAEGRATLVGYLPAGFPTVDDSIALIAAMVEGGVDVVEIGLPYSDPVMDGPSIQAAADIALRAGVRIRDVFRVVEATAAVAPTLVMTYWNPVERFGVERFADQLVAAGGSGLITPDLIPDEADEWVVAADSHDLDKVFLVAPSSTDRRLEMTSAACRGFVYATSVMGVTGARTKTSSAAPELVARVRGLSDLPVAVGLGVSNGDQAAEVAAFADGVVVGSAFVNAVRSTVSDSVSAVRDLAAELAEGVRREPTARA
ncbi:MAG TPA: tryptophan synthase subunit alpha [Nocardioidaceae bacterium]|nr:tryptophan synthase subunit alpha [Nocardioidaceae bacterium]